MDATARLVTPVTTPKEALMTNRVRIAVMALSAAIVAVGASALRAPEAHAAKICSNTNCLANDQCAYKNSWTCTLTKTRDAEGHIQYNCSEDQC
jgi:hypothetical protein